MDGQSSGSPESRAGEINRVFYDRAYGNRSAAWALVRQMLSYDQQCKARVNLRLLREKFSGKESLVILDYGFGNGAFLNSLPKAFSAYGCELSESAIANFRRVSALSGKSVQLLSTDQFLQASELPKFDVIACSHVLEHVEDDEALLISFIDRLAATGCLLINVPLNELWVDPNHVRSYSELSLRQLLAKGGLSVERIEIADRLSALVLELSMRRGAWGRTVAALIKAAFVLSPGVIKELMERLVPRRFSCQQLAVIAGRI